MSKAAFKVYKDVICTSFFIDSICYHKASEELSIALRTSHREYLDSRNRKQFDENNSENSYYSIMCSEISKMRATLSVRFMVLF